MKIQDIKQRNTKGMFGWYSQELKKKILKTCLIEKVIFVFLVLHVLKMTKKCWEKWGTRMKIEKKNPDIFRFSVLIFLELFC